MYFRLLSIFAVLISLVHGLSDSFALDYEGGLSVTLLHALDSAQPDLFTFRGNLTVSGSRSNVVQEPLTSAERQNLKSLAEQESFYRLKAIVTYNDGSTSSFLTFSKAVYCKFYLFFLAVQLMTSLLLFSAAWPSPS